jgi:hypothetical protein
LRIKIKGLSIAVHVLVGALLLLIPFVSTDQIDLITQPIAINSSEFLMPI